MFAGKNRNFGRALLVGTALSIVSTSQVYAQSSSSTRPEADPAGHGGLEEIVVTAQKREESINDVGLAIVAVDGDTLAERNIVSSEDLIRVVPGFNYVNSGYGTPVYSIRGVGFNDNSLSGSPAVSVYIDEVALPYNIMTRGAVLDLQRVEALKGPQGTLFGQNSTGGAINYIANKPTDQVEAGGSLTFGRFNYGRLQGYLSGPLAEGLTARLAFSQEIAGDWQRSLTRDEGLGEIKRGSARILVNWEATSNLTFKLNANGWYDRSDPQASQLVAIQFGNSTPAFQLPEVRNAPISPRNARLADWNPLRHPFTHDNFYQVSLRADWMLNDAVSLTSITAFSHLDRRDRVDIDGIAAANSEIDLQGNIRAFNQEVRLAVDTGGFHGVIGGTYSKDRIVDNQPLQFYPTSSGAQNVAGVRLMGGSAFGRQRVEAKAVFANAELQVLDQLKILGGVRYTKERRDFEGCARDLGDGRAAQAYTNLQQFFSGGVPPATPFVAGGCVTLGPPPLLSPTNVVDLLEQDNVSWNIGVNVNPVPDTLLYGRVSKGYKSGSFPSLSYTFASQARPVVQESVMAYEVGFKSTLLDRRLHLEGALFYYDYKDKQLLGKQVFFPIPTALNALQNIPKSRVKGAEFSATIQPTKGFVVSGSVNYIDTKVIEFFGYDFYGLSQRDLSGVEFNYSPKWQFQAGAQYDWDISADLTGSLGIDYVHRSSATAALGGADALNEIPAFGLLDIRASVGAPGDRWRLTIWGKNITNEFYLTQVQKTVDVVTHYTGQPATYGATIAVKF